MRAVHPLGLREQARHFPVFPGPRLKTCFFYFYFSKELKRGILWNSFFGLRLPRAQNGIFSKFASGRDPEKGSKKSRPLGRAHPDLDEVVIRDETEVHNGRSAEGLDRVAVVTETNARE